ncbi:hypothetical Protein YC6258_00830 [Gynuella sunshinyii YC6258]|uniref:Uncharacterized protein n=1 Tax=Gynuella sunshinyii YC6258 TaxID=1445510 RepID=A0A0C5UZZ1_9GAMM|nr:hypothetical Protein YC6258_00830 [Gynuella sunshinyii YC6258]
MLQAGVFFVFKVFKLSLQQASDVPLFQPVVIPRHVDHTAQRF